MKVYIDELPKNCGECFCKVEDTWCALSDGEMGAICEECDNKTRHKKCPLQLLTNYTKQVRNEVIDEIKENLLKLESNCIKQPNLYDFNCQEIIDILDQIQDKGE